MSGCENKSYKILWVRQYYADPPGYSLDVKINRTELTHVDARYSLGRDSSRLGHNLDKCWLLGISTGYCFESLNVWVICVPAGCPTASPSPMPPTKEVAPSDRKSHRSAKYLCDFGYNLIADNLASHWFTANKFSRSGGLQATDNTSGLPENGCQYTGDNWRTPRAVAKALNFAPEPEEC